MLRTAIRRASAAARPQARRALSAEASITVDFPGAYTAHLGDEPAATAETNKTELLEYFKTMYTMRRMEITCDNEYKARTIRGFCHLYDGQEAIGTGVQAALSPEDSWITSYRCHCIALARGGTVEGVLAELMGQSHGQTGGKGGSMHFYNKEHNFFGGQGIVGAQVPVGTGLAFANKYKTPLGEPMPVAIGCYGDGAANQGQIWEAANMAALRVELESSTTLHFEGVSAMGVSDLGERDLSGPSESETFDLGSFELRERDLMGPSSSPVSDLRDLDEG